MCVSGKLRHLGKARESLSNGHIDGDSATQKIAFVLSEYLWGEQGEQPIYKNPKIF